MTQLATTTPTTNGEAPLPRRAGTRALLPSAWLNRTLHLEYVGASSEAQETTATLLDWCPIGLLLNIAGAKTLLPRERRLVQASGKRTEEVEDRQAWEGLEHTSGHVRGKAEGEGE